MSIEDEEYLVAENDRLREEIADLTFMLDTQQKLIERSGEWLRARSQALNEIALLHSPTSAHTCAVCNPAGPHRDFPCPTRRLAASQGV